MLFLAGGSEVLPCLQPAVSGLGPIGFGVQGFGFTLSGVYTKLAKLCPKP